MCKFVQTKFCVCNFVMGQHIVIRFVSLAFLNDKNVCLALWISVLSAIQSEILHFLFSAAILDAILNISGNLVMGQHIVINFVFNECLDHKNVCLALEISVLSAIQSEILNFLFSAAIINAILNISANNLFPDGPISQNDWCTRVYFWWKFGAFITKQTIGLLCRPTNV